jgi:hypothetical protein
MKRVAAVFIIVLFVLYSKAQGIQTIVPKQVVAGNAFQIQYIVGEPSSFETITAPGFNNLRLISGPNYYKGNSLVNGKVQPIENITYTVVPLRVGIIKIDGARIRFKDGSEKTTSEVMVTAIPQPKASFNAVSTYTDISLYAPSSKTDLDKLIEVNLFIEAEVDKKVCFLGEVITASFKLYSRLQSISEVVNAPSLYGFSVMDVLNINEAHQAVETINGRIFNTSILRKLQLYPSQTGKLIVDEMQLQNSIEFDDSSTGRKIKIEKLLASDPIAITVKPLPPERPGSYTGAVGQFTVNANLPNTKIEANAQGKLIVTIDGKGNFIQFGPPTIQWPKEFDVFDPMISDELDKNAAPTEGKRNYVFSFTTNRTGSFSIPPVSFSFFDPASRKYREVSTDSLKLEILPATSHKNDKEGKGNTQSRTNNWIFLLAIPVLLALMAILFLLKRKQETVQAPTVKPTDYVQQLNEIISQELSGKQFCFEIQKLLKAAIKEYDLSKEQTGELEVIEKDCQLLIYSDIGLEGKQEELQKRVENLLRQIGA